MSTGAGARPSWATPTESSSVDVAVFSGTVSKWTAAGVTITIQFVNGKVVAKQLSKGDKPSPQLKKTETAWLAGKR